MNMSSLIRTGKLSKSVFIKNNAAVLFTAIRTHWNKDYKPGPYPRTEQERAKAAEKYGLHPSEYEPYPDNGEGHGDYPKLPDISGDAKDPNYPWDNPDLKRNFNETIHADFDLMREDRYDVSAKLRTSIRMQYVQFLSVMIGSGLVYYLLDNFKMFHAAVPKQYPKEGKKHYLFETN